MCARYARGRDTTTCSEPRLWALVRFLEAASRASAAARVFVDDGPCPDRAVAQRAGLGFFGKNTNLLTRTHGSYVLLGAALTDVPLPPERRRSAMRHLHALPRRLPHRRAPDPVTSWIARAASATSRSSSAARCPKRAAEIGATCSAGRLPGGAPWNRLAAPTRDARLCPQRAPAPTSTRIPSSAFDEAATASVSAAAR